MMAHRMRIHNALKDKALSTDGSSHPCELHLSSTVIDVDPDAATISLLDGTKVTGDVVIGADGVHSKARRKVPGGENAKPFPSGKNAFRFMIQRQDALDDPATRKLCEKKGAFAVAVGVDRRIIMYDTANHTLLNFVCIHPDSETEAGEDWNSETSKSALLHVYRDWAPAFQAILRKASPESLKIWKLLDMENLPTWYNSRLALIGDAAHPFLPHQGQGAAIAIEDAVALGTVLERGLRADEVPQRLKLYNDIRYERACKVQEFTRMAGLDVQDGKLDSECLIPSHAYLSTVLTKPAVEFSRYSFAHDEFDNSAQKLREWKWAQLPKIAFRMPMAFGPDPSLCPSITSPRSPPTFRTTSVHFKTSRTLIKNLIVVPGSSKMFFETPGTLSNCSFVHTQFNNVPWLQGGGHSVIGFYIHDVVHKGSGGQHTRGTYVPIMFENLPHTMARDREVYGLPAVYSEINAYHSSDSSQVTASLNGCNWIRLKLEALKPGIAQTPPTSRIALLPDGVADTALFSSRTVPRFSLEGEADKASEVEAFAIKVSFQDDDSALQIQQAFVSSSATIRFEAQGPKESSILDPVVERLAEIPIYEILSAQVIVGSGTPGFKQAYRI